MIKSSLKHIALLNIFKYHAVECDNVKSSKLLTKLILQHIFSVEYLKLSLFIILRQKLQDKNKEVVLLDRKSKNDSLNNIAL